MSERRVVTFATPLEQELPNDPTMIGTLVAQLMTRARIELDKAGDGRAYCFKHIGLVIGDNGPSMFRGLFDAQVEVMVELDEAIPGHGKGMSDTPDMATEVDFAAMIRTKHSLQEIDDLLGQILIAAQTIRIQQVQATSEAKWSPELRKNADEAWHALNQAHEKLTELFDIAVTAMNKSMSDMLAADEAALLRFIRGEGEYRVYGKSISTYPGRDENNQLIYDTCVRLEQRGLIYRKLNLADYVLFVPAE